MPSTPATKVTLGFIGQGYVGKNYADSFEAAGYSVVRYALEEPYIQNKEQITSCDIVFIGVPTPTTPEGFDSSTVRSAVALVGAGKTAVIKSTLLPGTTEALQAEFSDRHIFFSPEFLCEATARQDVDKPFMSIVGIPQETAEARVAAELVLSLLPNAPYQKIMTSAEAEFFKYVHNVNGYMQVVFFNMLYDAANALGASWETITETIKADPFISNQYINPIHKSGRGAGGHCFIKDFAAFSELYEKLLPNDTAAQAFLHAAEVKNNQLLRESKKDIDLLEGVYGK